VPQVGHVAMFGSQGVSIRTGAIHLALGESKRPATLDVSVTKTPIPGKTIRK
jgi:hypothetical protein